MFFLFKRRKGGSLLVFSKLVAIKTMTEFLAEKIDKKLQDQEKLSEIEELILKPHRNRERIMSLTEKEIEEYRKINIEELKDTKISMNILLVCKSTQDFMNQNIDSILKIVRRKEQKKEEEESER